MTGRVVDSLEQSERFLWDLRKTIAELNNENYAGRPRELAHQHGMKLSIEAYGSGMFDDLSYAGRADIADGRVLDRRRRDGNPQGDGLGRTRLRPEHHRRRVVHRRHRSGQVDELARIRSRRWATPPSARASTASSSIATPCSRGSNRVPGMTMGPWGIHYERTETWWEQTGPWHEYLARCNYLLRQGLFVADICYLQTEDAPNGLAYAPRTAYEFDGCPPEVVLTRMKVGDGRLVLPDGMSYRLLVLPPSETMTPALLAKIKELVEAGATVVGPRPLKSPSLSDYPQCDAELQQLAAELWGDCDGKTVTEHRCGKGKMVCGQDARSRAGRDGRAARFPHAEDHVANADTSRYIHRAADGADIYFVANGSPRAVDAECMFRVKGKRPEFWHPDTGRIEPVAVYEEVDGGTRIPIWFDPSGSVFVVFRPDAGAAIGSGGCVEPRRKAGDQDRRSRAKIVVQKAVYGVPGDENRTRDVTGQAQRLVEPGAAFLPGRSHGRRRRSGLRRREDADRRLHGRRQALPRKRHRSASRSRWCARAIRATPRSATADGRLLIEAWKPGRYELKTASGKTASVEVPALPEPIDVAGPWELRFPAGWDAPESVTLDKLISWSEHPDAGVKYFSGTAAYAKTLHVPADMIAKNRRVYLDLGNVQVIAQVKLNGKDLGILWKAPFRFDVTDAVQRRRQRPGGSSDEQLGEPADRRRATARRTASGIPSGNLVEWPKWLLEGKPSPTGRHTFTTWRHWSKDSPLMESGLLGPVKCRRRNAQEVAF